MMKENTLSLLGCGWLGLPLARYLVLQGYQVNGSTTQSGQFENFKKAGVKPFLIQCLPQIKGENLEEFFRCSKLIITLPFKRDLKDPRFYQQQMDSIIQKVEASAKAGFVIFTSSTSVYPAATELAVEEECRPDNPRAKVLFDVEQSLMNNKYFSATVVRLGGLYGNDRPIGRIMAGRKDCPNAWQPVNLIHIDDAVQILAAILQQGLKREIINAVSDAHPARKELYTRAALSMGLEPPRFNDEPTRSRKVVSNRKLKDLIKYKFIHPDPTGDVISSSS